MAASFSPRADDELQALAEIIRTEFSVGPELDPLSEVEALRAASVVVDRLHGQGYDVVDLYPGEPWTTEAVADSDG